MKLLLDFRLPAIMLASVIFRLPYLAYPFERIDEIGTPYFNVFAANYHSFGYWNYGGYPIFGKVGEIPLVYPNHPPLGALLLGVWTQFFGNTEAATRCCSILLLLLGTLAIYVLAKENFSPQAGLWSAGFFALMPLEIYLGHLYLSETGFMVFSLTSMIFVLRWDRHGSIKNYGIGALLLALSYGFDYYAVFLSPYFLLLALLEWRKDGRTNKALGWLGLCLLPAALLFTQVLHLHWLGESKSWSRGVSKYQYIWNTVGSPKYWWRITERLVLLTGVIPVLAFFRGLKEAKRWNRSQKILVGLVTTVPMFFSVIGAVAIDRHVYLVLFFLPLIAILGGEGFCHLSRKLQALGFLLLLAFSWHYCKSLYQPVPYAESTNAARQIKQWTTDRDILIGLTSNQAYYVMRPAMVPYWFLWKDYSVKQSSEDLFAMLRPFARQAGYDRIILFTPFLLHEGTAEIDWSKTFDGLPGLQLMSEPQAPILVWQFRDPQPVPKDSLP